MKVAQTQEITTIEQLQERAEVISNAELEMFRRACLSPNRPLPKSYLASLSLEIFERHTCGPLLYATRDAWENDHGLYRLRGNLIGLIQHAPINLDGAALATVVIVLTLDNSRGIEALAMVNAVSNMHGFDIETLAPLLRETTAPARYRVFDALADKEEPGHEEFWVEALGNSLQKVRTTALAALEKKNPDIVRPLLLAKLGSGSKKLREGWIEALANAGVDASCVDALTDALEKEKHPDLRASLSALLEGIAGIDLSEVAGVDTSEAPEDQKPEHVRAAEVLAAMRKSKPPTFLAKELGAIEVSWCDGSQLGEDELHKLIARLRMEGPDEPPNAVTLEVCEGIERASLHNLGNVIEATWLARGAKASHKWALYQLAITGKDEDIDRIGPTLEELASSGSWRRAQWYLDVFERIGTPRARDWIYDAHAYAPGGSALYRHATEILERMIEASTLSHEDYYATIDMYVRERVREEAMSSPELIPGETRLELGARSLVVSMDAEFQLSLINPATHERATSWPSFEDGDDVEAYERSQKAFDNLKQEVEDFVKRWREHLEVAMISGRPFTMGYIRRCFLRHPVLERLLETLVFVLEDGRSVRITQGQVLDHDYDEVDLPDAQVLRLAHPLEVPEQVRHQWGVHLAECELIQIFPQFTRDICMRAHGSLATTLDMQGKTAYGPTLSLALERLGWHNGPVADGGYYSRSEHLLPGRGVRLFLYHSDLHIQSDEWSTSTISLRLDFRDLRNRKIPDDEVSDVVYSEACLLVARLRDAAIGKLD